MTHPTVTFEGVEYPVETHRIGINGQTHDHVDPHGWLWQKRQTTGASWAWWGTWVGLNPQVSDGADA